MQTSKPSSPQLKPTTTAWNETVKGKDVTTMKVSLICPAHGRVKRKFHGPTGQSIPKFSTESKKVLVAAHKDCS